MGKPLTIQATDEELIQELKDKLKLATKIEVVRRGLKLLEQKFERDQRILQWKKAASLVSRQSKKVNKEFQRHSRIKKNK